MFQMTDVGRKIAARRKEKNMTQMELADMMGVSFQAVSNWERGNSMPDIAKLPELAERLDLSIDELLTDGEPAKLVRHILDGDEEQYVKEAAVQPDTLADVAPILNARQTEKIMDAVLKNNTGPVGIPDLMPVAPFVSHSFLDTRVLDIASIDNVRDLVGLAPFLSTQALDALVDKVTEENFSLRAVAPLAPFLEKSSLDKLARRALVDTDLSGLAALAPFLSDKTLDYLAREISAKETPPFKILVSLAPFLSEETLDFLAGRAMDSASVNDLIKLAPFLPSKTLKKCADMLLKEMDLKSLIKLAPFLKND